MEGIDREAINKILRESELINYFIMDWEGTILYFNEAFETKFRPTDSYKSHITELFNIKFGNVKNKLKRSGKIRIILEPKSKVESNRFLWEMTSQEEHIHMLGLSTNLAKESVWMQIVDQLKAALILTDSKGKISYANKGFQEMTGLSSDEIHGSKYESVLQHLSTELKSLSEFRFATHNEKPFQIRMLSNKKTGNPFWTEIIGEPFYDINNNFEGYYNFQTNINQQHKADELNLTRIIRKLLIVVDRIPYPVLITSSDGKIKYSNNSMETSMGYSRKEFKQLHIQELIQKADTHPVDHQLRREMYKTGSFILLTKNKKSVSCQYLSINNLMKNMHLIMLTS